MAGRPEPMPWGALRRFLRDGGGPAPCGLGVPGPYATRTGREADGL